MCSECSAWGIRSGATARSDSPRRPSGGFWTTEPLPGLPSAKQGPYLSPLKGKLHDLGRTRAAPSGEEASPPRRPAPAEGPPEAHFLPPQLGLAAGGRDRRGNA